MGQKYVGQIAERTLFRAWHDTGHNFLLIMSIISVCFLYKGNRTSPIGQSASARFG
jgi:hypothetical protein